MSIRFLVLMIHMNWIHCRINNIHIKTMVNGLVAYSIYFNILRINKTYYNNTTKYVT